MDSQQFYIFPLPLLKPSDIQRYRTAGSVVLEALQWEEQPSLMTRRSVNRICEMDIGVRTARPVHTLREKAAALLAGSYSVLTRCKTGK